MRLNRTTRPRRSDPPFEELHLVLLRVYNSVVEPPLLDKTQSRDHLQHRHAAYAAEATGLLIIAIVLLVITIIRYWQVIPWSAR